MQSQAPKRKWLRRQIPPLRQSASKAAVLLLHHAALKWSSATGSHRASPACHAGVFTGSLADEIETDGLAPPMPGGRRVYSALHCYSATSRKMDLPRGRAPRCPRYQRGASLSTPWQNKMVPAAQRRRSPVIGLPADPLAVPVPPGRLREWGFLSESHRPRAAYDTAASTARPRNRKMWTAPDVRRVLPIKSRVHRCLCLRSERSGRRDLHAHATVGSEF